jgi:ribosomal protein L11 methyltransferase
MPESITHNNQAPVQWNQANVGYSMEKAVMNFNEPDLRPRTEWISTEPMTTRPTILEIAISTPVGCPAIRLESGPVFGSGAHESTQSCLRELVALSSRDDLKSLLDVGCGSGILSLAALAAGFRIAVAFDIDFQAARHCRNNGILNRQEKSLSCFCGDLTSLKNHVFDVVVANLQGDILLTLVGDIVSRVRAGGFLILAGIAWEWLDDIKLTYPSRGFQVVSLDLQEEFATFVLNRRE